MLCFYGSLKLHKSVWWDHPQGKRLKTKNEAEGPAVYNVDGFYVHTDGLCDLHKNLGCYCKVLSLQSKTQYTDVAAQLLGQELVSC